MSSQEETNQEQEDDIKEIISWELSKEQLKRFSIILEAFNIAQKTFLSTVIYNRGFCFKCATSDFLKKSYQSTLIINFIAEIQSVGYSQEDFIYLLQELWLTTSMLNYINKLPAETVQEMNLNILKLEYPTAITEKTNLAKLGALKVPNLAFNSIISEIGQKLLEIVGHFVYDIKLDKNVTRKVLEYLFQRIFCYVPHITYVYREEKNTWYLQLEKYAVEEYIKLDHCDPITLTMIVKE